MQKSEVFQNLYWVVKFRVVMVVVDKAETSLPSMDTSPLAPVSLLLNLISTYLLF
jgi:hypothetical protein